MLPDRSILLPVRPSTIVASFALALFLNFLPWRDMRVVPDFVALVLTFWCVRQPRLVGLGVAWTLGLLSDATEDMSNGDRLDGETAFKLYDTYGFPLDLTQDALRQRGIGVDLEGFNAAMERQKAEARASWAGSVPSPRIAAFATRSDRPSARPRPGSRDGCRRPRAWWSIRTRSSTARSSASTSTSASS